MRNLDESTAAQPFTLGKRPVYAMRLTTDEQFQKYQIQYQAISGFKVELDYLQRGVVIGLMRADDLMGGVILSTTAMQPLRATSVMPEADEDKLFSSRGINPADCLEVGALFIRTDVPVSAGIRLWFKGIMIHTIARFAKVYNMHYVLAGSFTDKLQADQRKLLPIVLYRTIHVKDEAARVVEIYCGPIWHFFVRSILLSIGKEVKRMLK